MIEIGKKYNRLTCIGKDTTKDKRYYLFRCECGNIKSIIACNVERGATKSCGCYSKEHPSHTTYGFSHTRIDNIYKSMISRCYIKRNNRYVNYGARNIKVYDEWLKDKTKFFEWSFKNGYKENLTIDRINVNGDYSPENCRWISHTEQSRNKTNNVYIEYKKRKMLLIDYAIQENISYGTAWERMKRGTDGIKRINNL